MYLRKVSIARAIHLNPYYRYYPCGIPVRFTLNNYKKFRYVKCLRRCLF